MHIDTFIQQLQAQPATLCLTPNERLGNFLQHAYGKAQAVNGETPWSPPAICSYHEWIKQQWQALTKAPSVSTWPRLLSPLVEDYFWQEAIQAHIPPYSLLKVHTLLPPIKQAWHFCQEWEIAWPHEALQTTLDSRFFAACATTYLENNETQRYLDRTQLAGFLLAHSEKLSFPATILLCGFDSLTPQQSHWLRVLENRGVSVSHIHLTAPQSQCTVHGFSDTEAEIRAMAQWAKERHKANPDASIACVFPQLTTLRPHIESIFQEIVGSHKLLTYPTNGPYNISGGLPFHQYAIIHTALQSLRLPSLSPEAFSEWLRSPYLTAAAEEEQIRCLLDATWREYPLGDDSPMESFYHHAIADKEKSQGPYQGEQLLQQLEKAMACFQSWPKKATFASWIGYFCDCLNALGWPGQSLSSMDYQCWQRWKSLLEEYQTPSAILPAITADKALQQLTLQCHFLFQGETPHAPIQVLGLLEAAGQVFQYCWIGQCHDLEWPAPPQPNPYLPLSLQRKLEMPHSSPERELLFFKTLTKNFSRSASKVIFSYPQQKDEEVLTISPLLTPFEQTVFPDELSPSPFLTKKIPSLVISCEETRGPQVSKKEIIQGGVGILQRQSACPFQAFAKVRLQAHGLQDFQKGLTPMERGSLVHHALELFWQMTKTQKHLLALSEKRLLTRIHRCATTAVAALAKTFHLSKARQQLECDRLCQLCLAWLTLEKEREPFSVLATEAPCEITLQGLPLQLRIDRIDTLSNGEPIVIDYKTSQCSIQSWFHERLDAPQLPLYAIIQRAKGIYFAQIRHQEVTFLGINKEDYDKDNISWHEQLDQWEKDLNQLAQNFMAGEAQADPKKAQGTCQYCDLDSLCRYEAHDL